jgi:hypothetical protein
VREGILCGNRLTDFYSVSPFFRDEKNWIYVEIDICPEMERVRGMRRGIISVLTLWITVMLVYLALFF